MVSIATDTTHLSVVDDVEFHTAAPDVVEILHGAWRLRVKRLDSGVAAALCRLASGPAAYAELEAVALATDPAADLGRLLQEVGRLVTRSLVAVRCVVDGEELLRATAASPLARLDASPPPDGAVLRLSRFAYARREGGAMVIESPASYARVEVHAPAVGTLLVRLADGSTAGRACSAVPGLAPDAASAAVRFLLGMGVLTTVDESGVAAEDAQPQVATREFHDVLMHAASRRGIGDRSLRDVLGFRAAIGPLPALREVPDGPQIPLPVPDTSELLAHDPPLSQAMENRRSVRVYGAEPITLGQLGEFLFRVARVDWTGPADPAAERSYEISRRPYPSGGACFDLEVYLTVHRCTGLGAGIYHYDPAGHRLTLVCDDPGPARQMLAHACRSTGAPEPPQVLVTLASRFSRISWKYEGIAYALTLKHVGVLYQTMYLTATAMGLAPCAVGTGDSAVFAQATGLDPLVESSVGEFMLGTRPQA